MMKHGKKVIVGNVTLVLDTKSDPDWLVLKTPTGEDKARQAKVTTGKRFRQGSNPDYTGYDAFPLQYCGPSGWVDYNSDAHKGALLDLTFLTRMVERF